jgi:glycosyltransferase involved in cell wall biosynthesis
VKLAVWSPLPPAPSGIADHVAESLPFLAAGSDLVAVVEDPAAVDADLARRVRLVSPADVPPVDLDLYHLGNSPAHGFVYRAASTRPGVVVFHEWNLHDLVLHVTVGHGDVASYVREMRRGHGPAGTFVARLVVRGVGGDLPASFALNDRVLESSLAVVGTTRFIVDQAARRRPDLPARHIPLHAPRLSEPLPDRAAARRALSLPEDALVLTAPGLATRAKRLDVAIRAAARLRGEHPSLRLVVVGRVDESVPLGAWGAEAGLGSAFVVTGRVGEQDFVRHLVAADLVLALRHPSRGEMSAVLLRALAVGRPVVVTAGTPAAREFPEGIVVPIDPGRHEEAELVATIDALARRPALCEALGRVARAFVREEHDPETLAARLLEFLAELVPQRELLRRRVTAVRSQDGTLLGSLLAELREAGRELGLGDLLPGCEEPLASLVGGTRR